MVDEAIVRAGKAVELMLRDEVDKAMNEYNCIKQTVKE